MWSPCACEMRTYLMFFGIEAELLQPADDQLLGVVGKDRIDEDDAVARRQRPGRVQLPADEIQVVEDLRGFGVPRVARRRAGGVGDVAGQRVGRVLAAALRQQARAGEGAEEVEARRRLRRLHGRPDLRIEVPGGRRPLREHFHSTSRYVTEPSIAIEPVRRTGRHDDHVALADLASEAALDTGAPHGVGSVGAGGGGSSVPPVTSDAAPSTM